IADPELLRNKDKDYTAVQGFQAGSRAPGADFVRYNTVSKEPGVPFELVVADGEHPVFIPVADDFKTSRPKTAELWIGLDYSQPGDRLAVAVGETTLEPAEVDVASSWRLV